MSRLDGILGEIVLVIVDDRERGSMCDRLARSPLDARRILVCREFKVKLCDVVLIDVHFFHQTLSQIIMDELTKTTQSIIPSEISSNCITTFSMYA